MSQNAMAQMESDAVDRVRDLRIGERPRSAKYIRVADLAVARRCCMRGERRDEGEPSGG